MENLSKEIIETLIEKSFEAQKNTHSPYSKFAVGASVLAKSGKIYTGANIENASYPAGICAERVAYSKAISEGERDFEAVCITCSGNDFAYPCGVCRQFMSEFGPNTTVVVARSKTDYKILSLEQLLPCAFEKDNLN